MMLCLDHHQTALSAPAVIFLLIAGAEECWLIPVDMSGAIHVSLSAMIAHCAEEVRLDINL